MMEMNDIYSRVTHFEASTAGRQEDHFGPPGRHLHQPTDPTEEEGVRAAGVICHRE